MINLDFDFIAGSIAGVILFSGCVWIWSKLLLRSRRRRKWNSALGRKRVNINKMLRGRICKHGETDTDFRLYYASDDITPIEFFNYVMNGLHWPEVRCVTQRKTHLHMYMASIDQDGKETDARVWFFGKDEQSEFIKELEHLFNTYVNAGCPTLQVEEAIESIVARARGQNVDLLNKYGFVWSEGS